MFAERKRKCNQIFTCFFLTVQSAANLGLVHGLSVLGSGGVKQTDLRVRQKKPRPAQGGWLC